MVGTITAEKSTNIQNPSTCGPKGRLFDGKVEGSSPTKSVQIWGPNFSASPNMDGIATQKLSSAQVSCCWGLKSAT